MIVPLSLQYILLPAIGQYAAVGNLIARRTVLYNMSMKRIMAVAGVLVVVLGAAGSVSAQTAAGGAAGSSAASPAVIVSPVSPSQPMPIAPPPVQPMSGFIQFNNLTVQSVSASNPPAEIIATNQEVVPMIYNGASGTGAGGAAGMGTGPAAGSAIDSAPVPTAASTNPASSPAASSVTCRQFDSASAVSGVVIPCPVPPSSAATSTTGAANPTTGVGAGTGAANMPMMPTTPAVYPIAPGYRIEIDATTQLMLRDRTSATLNDFTPGDQINVFGYYNTDGSIQAYLIRDLSEPMQTQTLQLNNVEIVSISGTSIPAMIAVTQEQAAPCYSFDANSVKLPYACPMGAQNVTQPAAIAMPNWIALRKYVVTVDARTIILDSNRTQLSLSNLNVGDELNVYGETTDNGQTLTADIVRDLSIPATPSTYTGTVTQVNSDGSFVFQSNDGRTITVQSPIQVGAALQLTGLLDRLQNVLSQVTSIVNAKNAIYPPVPMPTPMSVPVPAATPNTQN